MTSLQPPFLPTGSTWSHYTAPLQERTADLLALRDEAGLATSHAPLTAFGALAGSVGAIALIVGGFHATDAHLTKLNQAAKDALLGPGVTDQTRPLLLHYLEKGPHAAQGYGRRQVRSAVDRSYVYSTLARGTVPFVFEGKDWYFEGLVGNLLRFAIERGRWNRGEDALQPPDGRIMGRDGRILLERLGHDDNRFSRTGYAVRMPGGPVLVLQPREVSSSRFPRGIVMTQWTDMPSVLGVELQPLQGPPQGRHIRIDVPLPGAMLVDQKD